MKAKVIRRTCDELTRLLSETEKFVSDFKKDGTDELYNTPISPPKAYLLTLIACKKFNRKIPKVSFVNPSYVIVDGINFNDVRRIFLVRHDVKTFITQLSEYINQSSDKIYPQILEIWEERENGNWF